MALPKTTVVLRQLHYGNFYAFTQGDEDANDPATAAAFRDLFLMQHQLPINRRAVKDDRRELHRARAHTERAAAAVLWIAAQDVRH